MLVIRMSSHDFKSGQTFLDAGYCRGQDLRKLIKDGAPSSAAVYGLYVEPAIFDLGYELFRDKEKMHATCIAADLTSSSVPNIDRMRSSINVISAQSLFHLFTMKDQKTIAPHLSELRDYFLFTQIR